MFESHGKYDIGIENNLITLTVKGSWNIELANAFFMHFKSFMEKASNNFKPPFNILVISEDNWLATPECIEKLLEIPVIGRSHGIKNEAFVLETKLAESILKNTLLAPVDLPANYQFFTNLEDAHNWIKSLS
ncbi:hypothetical protein NBRC116188_27000 [Oceaniserpentilla sp. 4NH20-0058]|uniref:hypothetical protein n=1 Tax=Oceaniserpentilla sp. 4NH20-0058 TaxID=3127660 RepID=UPI003108758C